MYAIVETGGKQYRAEVGKVLDVELLDAGEGDGVEFDRVLLLTDESGTRVGTPTVEGARVKAQVMGTVKGPKVRIYKMRRRKGYRKQAGHRQGYSRVKVTAIEA
ncbi:MAG: 50S ribosomal protein L21 [Bradymonadales bacterium]|nr:50S ribosomal protein L21 [Bradymonadales bacterium]